MRKLKRSECAVMHLVLKGKWFAMIERGEKKEEYRLVTDYWNARVMNWDEKCRHRWKVVEFRHGYASDAPRLAFHVSRVRIRSAAVFKEWGEPDETHFAIELGERVELEDDRPRRKLPPILDAACGGRMMYFDKHDPRVLGMDNRTVPRHKIESNGAFFEVAPDVVGDFRNMPFPDRSFPLVVFDPPHLRCGETSFLHYKYGTLFTETWEEDLRRGFAECVRVLKPNGTLVFKWSDGFQPLKKVLELAPLKPVFFSSVPSRSKARTTYFVVFFKDGGR